MAHQRSLFRQLATALLTMQVVTVLAIGLYAWVQVDRASDRHTAEILGRIAALAQRDLAVAPGDDRTLQERVIELAAVLDVRITMIAPDGRVRADSHADLAQLDNHRFRPEVKSALSSGTGFAIRPSATLGTRMVYFARSMPGPGPGSSAVIRVAVPDELRATARTDALRTAGIGATALLVVSAIAVFVVTRLVSRNVGKLADGAARFAAGDLDHRIERTPGHELSTLVDALNDMATQLNEKIAELQSQRAEQQAMLQSMSNGVIALDSEQRFLNVNLAAERILTISDPLARGRLIQEVVREPELNQFVTSVFAGTGRATGEFDLHQHGTTHVRAVSEPLLNSAGTRVGALILVNDVTRIRRLESIRSDFAANVSHELRTPITNIKGYVETILEVGNEDWEQTRKFLEVIRRNAARLEAIIEDLLSLAQLEREGAPLSSAPNSVAELAESVVREHEGSAATRSITIGVDISRSLRVFGTRQLLEQALGNLLANAINYSGANTRIEIRAHAEGGDMVAIEVVDQGPGIAAEHLPRLFERFYRADSARSRDLGGTGLGLAIVKHIALVHGGRAEVESSVGQGSTFWIVLPINEPPRLEA